LVGGKNLNLSFAQQSDNRWLKGSICVTIHNETAVVKKYGTPAGTPEVPIPVAQAPQFVRGIAQIGWQISESHVLMPLPATERVDKLTYTLMGSNDSGTYSTGAFVPAAASTTDPGAREIIINDEDNNTNVVIN